MIISKTNKSAAVIFVAALVILISTGTRQSFGLFLKPISDTLGTGREVFSLAVAAQNLLYGLPLVGLLADWIGPRRLLVFGGALYSGGLLLVTRIASPAGLYLTWGLLVGIALSATSYVVLLGAVAQVVPAARRSQAFGLITASGSFGMFIMPLLVQELINGLAWTGALSALAVPMGLIVLLGWRLPQGPTSESGDVGEGPTPSLVRTLERARKHSGYWLLTLGFFVCGFHVAFIATHLPAFLSDQALSPRIGASALALIGIANIFGSYIFGYLGDRLRKKYLLSVLYGSRAVVITLFLLLPITNMSALVFGVVIGFLWLATVPLTSGLVAQIFGTRYMATLYGIVFFSHQLGAFLGVWLGGRLYDATGSYNLVWYVAIALSVLAALLHTPISDRPVTTFPSAAPPKLA